MSENPWLSQAVRIAERPAQPERIEPSTTGPTVPHRGLEIAADVPRLPLREQSMSSELWWLGVHGGAGETSLAALVPQWRAAEHGWPWTLREEPTRVVLTARSSMAGLRAAQAAAIEWATGQVPFIQVVGLVIVADAPGRLPRPLRDFEHLVSGGFPRTWSVPWIEAWRLGQPPALSAAPREVHRLIDDLHALAHNETEGRTH